MVFVFMEGFFFLIFLFEFLVYGIGVSVWFSFAELVFVGFYGVLILMVFLNSGSYFWALVTSFFFSDL